MIQKYIRSLMFLFLTIAGTALAQQESILLSLTGMTGAAPGQFPGFGNLIQASDGNFYGTTENGGANGYGVAFKVSPTGTYTLLHSFSSAAIDGAIPLGGLIQGTDGNFYGTTSQGGTNNFGTIFQISATAPYTFTLMHSFATATDGIDPHAGLIQGKDGNLYGTTAGGGSTTNGTIFKITPIAPYAFTVMHTFASGAADGQFPYAPLVQGADGNFYGTTNEGGAYISTGGGGTVFMISPTAPYPLTLLYSFQNTPDGYAPYAPLIQGADGDFYGTTLEGGTGQGIVFKVNPAMPGTVTIMYSFLQGNIDGQNPRGGLVLGTDGNVYGTTSQGGGYLNGTMFSVGATAPYTYKQLHVFTFNVMTDGAQPFGGLLQASDGNFYGTSYYGGTGGDIANSYDGTVFSYAPATTLAGPVALTVPASIVAGASYTLGYAVANAYSSTLQQCFATNNAGDTTWTGVQTASPTITNVTLTAPTTPGSYTYTLTCGGMESGFATLVVTPAPSTPSAMLSPTSISFGNETVGTPTTATTVTLSNPGTATLNISSLMLTGAGAADFAIVNDTCGSTLAATKSCTLGVTFTPAAATSYSAAVSFTDNAAGSPQTIMLTGTGVAAAPIVSLTSAAAFGNQPEGTTSGLKPLTLSNTGNATLNISSITLTGTNPSNFAIDPSTTCGTMLTHGNSCTIYVSFSPIADATYSATLSVADNATDTPHTAALTGTGTYVAPTVTLTPNSVPFGDIVQGSKSTAQTVTLTNTGTVAYNISSYGVSDATDYTFTTTCGSVVLPAAPCTFSVTFQPASVATLNATLTVNDTTDAVNVSTSLTGAGIPMFTGFSVTPTTPTGSVANGGIAQFTINVSALSGGYSNPVTMSISGLPAGATASFNPATVTPGSGSATTVLSIQTPSLVAQNGSQNSGRAAWLALLLLPLFGQSRLRRKLAQAPFALRALLLCAAGIGLLLPMAGCNGGFFGPTAHTSILTITGTSGSVQHSTTVTLTVQ